MEKINLDKLNSNDPKIKYAFAKELLQLSNESPDKVYANFDDWVELLNEENNVIKWTAIDIIGHLSVVDTDNRIDSEIMDKLFALLHDCKLITCNHAIFALGVIAQNKPAYKEEIIKKLLLVTDNDFETDDCEAIATGKVLEALQPFVTELKSDKRIMDFAKTATNSPRSSTKRKACEFLKLMGKG